MVEFATGGSASDSRAPPWKVLISAFGLLDGFQGNTSTHQRPVPAARTQAGRGRTSICAMPLLPLSRLALHANSVIINCMTAHSPLPPFRPPALQVG